MDENPYQGPKTDDLGKSPPSGPLRTALGCLAALGFLGIVVLFLLPSVRTARPAARRNMCANHLKQIAIALNGYASNYGAFPPACTVDADGKPLHSWRALILPYLEERALYDSIDFTKPWDDPVNAKARQTTVAAYQCPSVPELGNRTTYLAVVTPGSCLRPGESCRPLDVTDGPRRTLLVIDADAAHAVPWMSPNDFDEQRFLAIGPDTELPHPGGVQAVFADGSIHFLQDDLPAAERRALISAAGNDNAELKDFD